MTTTELLHCLACGSSTLGSALELPDQPPANLLLSAPDEAFPTYPLHLMFCRACGHGQLSHAVNPNELFGRGYRYRSGVSQTSQELFGWFADCLARIYPPRGANQKTWRKCKLLDIGCNDGTLLKHLCARGLTDLWGIDSDEQLCRESSHHASIIQGFWPGHWHLPQDFDAIIAWNVLAHGPNPLQFLTAVRERLRPGGLAFVLCSKSDMLETGAFDSIYHEHVSYFNQASMERLAVWAGMTLHSQVFQVRMHGVSDLYVLSRVEDGLRPNLADSGLDKGKFGLGVAAQQTKLKTEVDYVAFRDRAQDHIGRIGALSPSPHPIVFVGAAAKAMVVLHSTNIRPRAVFDESPSKVGRWIPSEGRLIQPLSNLSNINSKVLAVLSAWNFAEELEAKVRAVREPLRLQTEFLTYFPGLCYWT